MKSFIKTALFSIIFCGFFTNYILAQSDRHVNTLFQKYPNARQMKWEMDDGFMTAEFLDANRQEVEVSLDMEGNWVRTKTDFSYRNLPENIKTAFLNSEYAKWKIDDIDFIEKPSEEGMYIFDLERGEMERKLYISEKGSIVQER